MNKKELIKIEKEIEKEKRAIKLFQDRIKVLEIEIKYLKENTKGTDDFIKHRRLKIKNIKHYIELSKLAIRYLKGVKNDEVKLSDNYEVLICPTIPGQSQYELPPQFKDNSVELLFIDNERYGELDYKFFEEFLDRFCGKDIDPEKKENNEEFTKLFFMHNNKITIVPTPKKYDTLAVIGKKQSNKLTK